MEFEELENCFETFYKIEVRNGVADLNNDFLLRKFLEQGSKAISFCIQCNEISKEETIRATAKLLGLIRPVTVRFVEISIGTNEPTEFWQTILDALPDSVEYLDISHLPSESWKIPSHVHSIKCYEYEQSHGYLESREGNVEWGDPEGETQIKLRCKSLHLGFSTPDLLDAENLETLIIHEFLPIPSSVKNLQLCLEELVSYHIPSHVEVLYLSEPLLADVFEGLTGGENLRKLYISDGDIDVSMFPKLEVYKTNQPGSSFGNDSELRYMQ
jgi:hypothetical protein